MTKDEFKRHNRISAVLQSRGINARPSDGEASIKCPLHEDKNPSFGYNDAKGLWKCHAGCGGGDVFTLLAKLENTTEAAILKKYTTTQEGQAYTPAATEKLQIERVYSYQDANGKEVFQVVRMIPKTFRQRHMVGGKWVWGMDGVTRVLYRLPEVLKAKTVWIVEGEKDADNLRALGFTATCNAGGAGKWLDSYTDALKDKEVILCGDNDEPGRQHIDKVTVSLREKVASVRHVKLPGHVKDVSDFIAQWPNREEAKASLDGLVSEAQVLIKGVHVPILSISEMEERYVRHIQNLKQNQLNLSKWLPSLEGKVRGLVPGEVVTILAGTGVGKTAILQNIAAHAAPHPTLIFEMELPGELLFERFVSVKSTQTLKQIEQTYFSDAAERISHQLQLDHVFSCVESRLTMTKMEEIINVAELKIGERPKVVLVDYIQLLQGGKGSRYERMSSIAEDLKVVAKSTGTIIFVSSQVGRKPEVPDGEDQEVSLFDAKDSGSIENSSGLVLGAWRSAKDRSTMFIKILKNTKGVPGAVIACDFDGEKMRITEKEQPSRFEEEADYFNRIDRPTAATRPAQPTKRKWGK